MTELETNAFTQMDAMYRYQRHFYDATRRFYLLGRDRLIEKMMISDGDRIAEIGCGTGRNLAILAGRYPRSNFYGLDASGEMLATAAANLAAFSNVTLTRELAEDLDHRKTFGLDDPLDAIFFSYSITMIPAWRESVLRALANLKGGGRLYIVDFYDQRELPRLFRFLLKAWLRKFHVQFWSELMPFLHRLDIDGRATLEIESVARRYAFIATLTKAGDS